MARPEYADERSFKYFRTGYVGEKHGDNGTAYSSTWDSTSEGLRPTRVHTTRNYAYCAYCGNRALPIQQRVNRVRSFSVRYDYKDAGHTCCCTGAVDEAEYHTKRDEMLERHRGELRALEDTAPKPNPEVVPALAEKVMADIMKDIKRDWFVEDKLKMLGITKGTLHGKEEY